MGTVRHWRTAGQNLQTEHLTMATQDPNAFDGAVEFLVADGAGAVGQAGEAFEGQGDGDGAAQVIVGGDVVRVSGAVEGGDHFLGGEGVFHAEDERAVVGVEPLAAGDDREEPGGVVLADHGGALALSDEPGQAAGHVGEQVQAGAGEERRAAGVLDREDD